MRAVMNLTRLRPKGMAAALLTAGAACAASAGQPSDCGAPSAAMPVSATPGSAVPDAIVGQLAQPGGQALEFWIHRANRPRATLVFENGLMLPFTTWTKVVQALGDEADMVLYNRPGVGRSAAREQTQDPATTVRLLRDLLREQGVSAPYILVGHSLGGQYAQLFARLYPQEVGALLLVDALPPGVLKPTDQFPWYTQLGLQLFAPEYARREIAGAHAMGELLLGEPGTFDKPMIRLVAAPDPAVGKPEGLIVDLAKGVIYAEDFGVWAVDPDIAEKRLDLLYPRSVVRELRARHRMQEDAPTVVVDAIRELMAQAGCSRL